MAKVASIYALIQPPPLSNEMSSKANTPSSATTPEEAQVIDSNMPESGSSDQAYGRAELSSSTKVSTRRSSSTTPPPSKRLKTGDSATIMADDTLSQAPDATQQQSPSSPSKIKGQEVLPQELVCHPFPLSLSNPSEREKVLFPHSRNSKLPPTRKTHANMRQWRNISKLLDTPDLQSFRQVCKLFAGLGLDLMMETINLVGTQKNYDQLNDKLQNPSALDSIQRNMKTLRIFTMHTEVPIVGEDDPQDESLEEKILEDYENVRLNFVDRQFLGGAVNFPLLDKLVIKGAMFLEDWVQPPINGFAVGAQHARGVEMLTDYLRIDMNGRALACAAIGIHKHKLTPRILHAEVGCEYLGDAEIRRDVQYLFRHLEEISLYINIYDMERPWGVHFLSPGGFVPANPQRHWAECFGSAECVRTISIAFEWDQWATWESTSLEHWFGTTQWEHLHTLNLVNLKCDSDSLLRVIHRNGSSLCNLSFTTLAVGPGQLESFFRTLREYTEAGEIDLETLELENKLWEVTNLADVTAEETHFYYLVDALPNLDDPTTQQFKENGHWPEGWPAEGKELRDAVEEYVLCGGPETWGLYTWPALVSQFYEVPGAFLDVEEL